MKIYVTVILAITAILAGVTANADKTRFGSTPEQNNTALFINESNQVLYTALKAFRKNNVKTNGKLAKAIDHQKYARKMYYNKKYKKAILHSWKARRLAFIVIKANNGIIKPDWLVTAQKVCPPLNKTVLENNRTKIVDNKEDIGSFELELDNGIDQNSDDNKVTDTDIESVKIN